MNSQLRPLLLLLLFVPLAACTSMILDRLTTVPHMKKTALGQHDQLGPCILEKVRSFTIPDLFGPSAIYADAIGSNRKNTYTILPNETSVVGGGPAPMWFEKTNSWILTISRRNDKEVKISLKSDYNKIHKTFSAPVEDLEKFIDQCAK